MSPDKLVLIDAITGHHIALDPARAEVTVRDPDRLAAVTFTRDDADRIERAYRSADPADFLPTRLGLQVFRKFAPVFTPGDARHAGLALAVAAKKAVAEYLRTRKTGFAPADDFHVQQAARLAIRFGFDAERPYSERSTAFVEVAWHIVESACGCDAPPEGGIDDE